MSARAPWWPALSHRDGGRMRGRCSRGHAFAAPRDVRLAPACPPSPYPHLRCWDETDVYGDAWWYGETGTSNSEEWCHAPRHYERDRYPTSCFETWCRTSAPSLPETWCWPWPEMAWRWLRLLERSPRPVGSALWHAHEALWITRLPCHCASTPWLGRGMDSFWAEHGIDLPHPAGAATAAHREATGKLWRVGEACTMQQPEARSTCLRSSARGWSA